CLPWFSSSQPHWCTHQKSRGNKEKCQYGRYTGTMPLLCSGLEGTQHSASSIQHSARKQHQLTGEFTRARKGTVSESFVLHLHPGLELSAEQPDCRPLSSGSTLSRSDDNQ